MHASLPDVALTESAKNQATSHTPNGDCLKGDGDHAWWGGPGHVTPWTTTCLVAFFGLTYGAKAAQRAMQSPYLQRVSDRPFTLGHGPNFPF
jgi:hypothetical protein